MYLYTIIVFLMSLTANIYGADDKQPVKQTAVLEFLHGGKQRLVFSDGRTTEGRLYYDDCGNPRFLVKPVKHPPEDQTIEKSDISGKKSGND